MTIKVKEKITNKRIGENIRALREAHHMTQRDLAQKIGVRQDAISRIENGNSISSYALVEVSNMFNCNIADLILGEISAKESQREELLNNFAILHNRDKEIIENIKVIPHSRVRKLLRITRKLVKQDELRKTAWPVDEEEV